MTDHRQRALLQLVRDVSRRQIAPRAERHTPGVPFPAEVFALLAELDLLGLSFPVDDGGLGQPTTVVCQVLAELSQAFPAVGLGARMHLLTTGIVARHARSAVRDEVLPQLIAGEWLAAHGIAVRGSAPVTSLRIAREGDSYVVSGAVAGVTHAGHADCYVVVGRMSDDDDDGTMLLVAADSVGLDATADDPTAVDHAPSAGTLQCRNVRVPTVQRLGDEGHAAVIVADLVDEAHLGVAACAVGLARAALQAAVTCVREHGPASARATAGDVMDAIADMAAAVEAADALCERAAAAVDAGRSGLATAAMARIVATGAAVDATTRAATVHDGIGCAVATKLARYRLEAMALRHVDGGDAAARRTVGGAIAGDLDDDGR